MPLDSRIGSKGGLPVVRRLTPESGQLSSGHVPPTPEALDASRLGGLPPIRFRLTYASKRIAPPARGLRLRSQGLLTAASGQRSRATIRRARSRSSRAGAPSAGLTLLGALPIPKAAPGEILTPRAAVVRGCRSVL